MSRFQKGFVGTILIVVVAILLIGGAVYFATHEKAEAPGVACTMDAMMCPDGSYVGRSGPNCQFVCPK